MKGLDIVKRFDAQKSLRTTVEHTWELINKFVVPYRGDFFREITSEHAVDWRENREIFDSTAFDAANILASTIHGSLTSASIRWFEIAYRQSKLNSDKSAKMWLENATDITYLSLQESNFNLEANETYLDLVSYGNSFISEEEVTDASGELQDIRFQAAPVADSYFEPSWNGQIRVYFRLHKMDAGQIVDKFTDLSPEAISKLPEVVQAQYAKGEFAEKHDVVFCVYPRDNKYGNLNSPRKLAPLERPFGYKYIFYRDKSELGDEGGYYEMPVFAPRWRKTSSSQWGHGPALIALPDILTLNRVVELTLAAGEKALDPPSLVQQRALMSDLDLAAGGQTVVRDIDGIKPYISGMDFGVGELQRENLVKSIQSKFFIDQLQLKDSPSMTATETQVRYELMQRLLGPTLGRLQNDYLDPLVQRTFNINMRAGRFEDVPDALAESNVDLEIVYTGPLVRAQKADITQGVTRWMATIAELSSIKPEILDNVDWDTAAQQLGGLEGVPAMFMNDETTRKKIRKLRREQEQAMEEAMIAKEQGEAAKVQNEADQLAGETQ